MAAKITKEMLQELALEDFNPSEWAEETFEDAEILVALISRVFLISLFAPLAPEDAFISGLSIGVQLGQRLAQIELLDQKLTDG